MKTLIRYATTVITLLGGYGAVAAPAIVLPPERATLKPGAGADLATANCLMCHSANYISTAPVFPRAYWQATVAKMVNKYGAPVAKEQVEPIVDYLTKSYGDEKAGALPQPAPSPEKREKEGSRG